MAIPDLPLRRDTRIFISAVTRELGSVRKLVKKALEDNDHHAIEQDNFPLDYRELVEKLRARIASCDAVVHIVGRCYGAEPTERPSDAPRRSYTQLEYDMAVELNKPVYVFLTGDSFPSDAHDPESAELQALQQAHRQRLMASGRDYDRAASTEQLDQKVRTLQLKVERLQHELQQVDQQVASAGRRLSLWLVLFAGLAIAALGAVGYLGWQLHSERIAADAARREILRAQLEIQRTQQTYAELLLEILRKDKDISAITARELAVKEVAEQSKRPQSEIETQIGTFVPNLGFAYQPIHYADGTFGARLTRDPAPGSPAAQIGLETGDIIFMLDGMRFRIPDDVLNHRGVILVELIDVRKNQRLSNIITLP